MVKYFISYDLRNGRDYQPLFDELAKFKAIQVLESVWCLIYQDEKTKDFRDHFKNFIGKDDGLIIIKSAFWASERVNNNPNDLR